MPQLRLTDKTVRALATKKTQEDFWDERFSGGSFGVRVTSRGRKSFVVMYRVGRRLRRLTLGPYPAISLADARQRARQVIGEATQGVDPVERRKRDLRAMSFGDLAEMFMELHASQRAKKTRREYARQLRHDLLPRWSGLGAAEITRADVISLLV